MLKLLIVDDEDITRYGIISVFDWGKMGIGSIEQAENGIEALAIAKDFKPDILLTDLRMPHMDGIELSFKLRTLLPNINLDNEVLILTVQDDGVGIPEAKIRSIFSGKVESKNGNGIGLKNTNERLKLFFGDEFGIICKSAFGEGSIVEIKIKAIVYDTQELKVNPQMD